eukprot:Lankesteria_metandrocarpae@DN5051_c0_g1_i1.p1
MRVYARVKPSKNQQDSVLNGIGTKKDESAEKSKVTIQISKQTNDTKTFHLDDVFGGEATQKEVYDLTSAPLVQAVMCGFNATILAYGQTSSGKTHTMEGPPIMRSSNTKPNGEVGLSPEEADELMGVVPRAVRDIFREIERRKQRLGGNVEEITLTLSVMEIYMENVHDLLCPARSRKKENLKIREDPSRGVFVEGITELTVITQDEILDALAIGQGNRAVGDTNMNQFSSRSHLVCTISVRHKNNITLTQRVGKLHLVDLAGSEKANKSMVEGLSLDESKTINKSLSCLGNVIHALTDSKGAEKGGRNHIPYRDSKLTRILQESLGGNSKTTLICTVSAADTEKGETLSTLRFGQRAKRVTNTAVINQERSVQFLEMLLKRSEKKIKQLKGRVARLERSLNEHKVELPVEASGGAEAHDVSELEMSPRQPLLPTLSMLRSFSMGSAPMMADVNEEESRPIPSDSEGNERIAHSCDDRSTKTLLFSRRRSGPALIGATSDDDSDADNYDSSSSPNTGRQIFTAKSAVSCCDLEPTKSIPLLKLEQRKGDDRHGGDNSQPLSSSTHTADSASTDHSHDRSMVPLFTFGNLKAADLYSSEGTDRTNDSISAATLEPIVPTVKEIWLRPRGREVFSARRSAALKRQVVLTQQRSESVVTDGSRLSVTETIIEPESTLTFGPCPPSPPCSSVSSSSTLEVPWTTKYTTDEGCDDSPFPPSPPSPPLDSVSTSSDDIPDYCSASHSTAACHNSAHTIDSAQMRGKIEVFKPNVTSAPQKSTKFATKHLLLDLMEANRVVDGLCDSNVSLFSDFMFLLLDNHGLKAELLALRSRLAVDAVRLLRRRRRAATNRSGCISGRLRFLSNCPTEDYELAGNESSSDDERVVRAVKKNMGRRCGPVGGWSDFIGKQSGGTRNHGVVEEDSGACWGRRMEGGDRGLTYLFSPGLWEAFDRGFSAEESRRHADSSTGPAASPSSRQVTIGLQTSDSLAWHDQDSTVDAQSDRMHENIEENQLDGMTCFAPSRLVTLAESLQKAFFSGNDYNPDATKLSIDSLSPYVNCYAGVESSTSTPQNLSTLLAPPLAELQRRQRRGLRRLSHPSLPPAFPGVWSLNSMECTHNRSIQNLRTNFANGVLFSKDRMARRWSLPSPIQTLLLDERLPTIDKIPQLFASVAAQQVKNKRSGLRNKRPRRIRTQRPTRPTVSQPYTTPNRHSSCIPKCLPVSPMEELYFPSPPPALNAKPKTERITWLDISGNGAAGTGESSSAVICVDHYRDSRIPSQFPSVSRETSANPDHTASHVTQLFGGFLAGAFKFLDGRAS